MHPTQPIEILDAVAIRQKVNRMAYQVYENNYGEAELLICGIAERGFLLAEKIHKTLLEIADFKLQLAKVSVDKNSPNSEGVHINPPFVGMENKVVILCDDVLYSGRTLAYASVPILNAGVKKLQCLVLIHRNHLHFPIQPTYIGMQLATTLQENVEVDFANEKVTLV